MCVFSNCWFYHLSRFKTPIGEKRLPAWISSFSSHFTPRHAAVIHHKIPFFMDTGIFIPSFVRKLQLWPVQSSYSFFLLDTCTVGDAGIAAYCSLYFSQQSLWVTLDKLAKRLDCEASPRHFILYNGCIETGNKVLQWRETRSRAEGSSLN